MDITFVTTVNAPFDHVKNNFTDSLLLYTIPSFIKVEVQEYGGNETGNRVVFLIKFAGRSFFWRGVIDGHREGQNLYAFRDTGQVIPAPLKKWQHFHCIKVRNNKTVIYDRVRVRFSNWFFSVIFTPALIFGFWFRKTKYRKFFTLHSNV